MKSAKEQFEELNYVQEKIDEDYINYCWYYDGDMDCVRKISFDLKNKSFLAYSPYNLDVYEDCSIDIGLEELQAINKQVKELGWK